jgi:hypothetical protein
MSWKWSLLVLLLVGRRPSHRNVRFNFYFSCLYMLVLQP